MGNGDASYNTNCYRLMCHIHCNRVPPLNTFTLFHNIKNPFRNAELFRTNKQKKTKMSKTNNLIFSLIISFVFFFIIVRSCQQSTDPIWVNQVTIMARLTHNKEIICFKCLVPDRIGFLFVWFSDGFCFSLIYQWNYKINFIIILKCHSWPRLNTCTAWWHTVNCQKHQQVAFEIRMILIRLFLFLFSM